MTYKHSWLAASECQFFCPLTHSDKPRLKSRNKHYCRFLYHWGGLSKDVYNVRYFNSFTYVRDYYTKVTFLYLILFSNTTCITSSVAYATTLWILLELIFDLMFSTGQPFCCLTGCK